MELFGEKKDIKSEIEVGLLQMQILWLLNRKPTHGYEMMKVLTEMKRTKITQVTLYPTLARLESLRLISGKENDGKKVYSITVKGSKVMHEACIDFSRTFFGIFRDFACSTCVSHQIVQNKAVNIG